MAGTLTIAKKEISDHFGSKRFIILFGLILLLSTLTAYQGVNYIRKNPEAEFISLFSGATGSGFSFIMIIAFFGPLIGLALGFDAINKEIIGGTLSLILGQPIYRDSVINGKFLASATALATLTAGMVGIMCGLAIPMLGFGPTIGDALKVVALASLTVLYFVFWLSLGMLFSVLAKKTATSILASIATWLTFTIIMMIVAVFVSSMLVPLPGGGMQMGQGVNFEMSPEYRETVQKRFALSSRIMRMSPAQQYIEAASSILGQFAGGHVGFEFERTITLSEALTASWANIATLAVGLVVFFATSYMKFLRSEIRPGG
jgi:ABC-2 type transport system permease protein